MSLDQEKAILALSKSELHILLDNEYFPEYFTGADVIEGEILMKAFVKMSVKNKCLILLQKMNYLSDVASMFKIVNMKKINHDKHIIELILKLKTK